MWIQPVGIAGIAHAERPGQSGGHFPRVLRIEIQVEEIVWLGVGHRERSYRAGITARARSGDLQVGEAASSRFHMNQDFGNAAQLTQHRVPH
jgi:hypothetical protein